MNLLIWRSDDGRSIRAFTDTPEARQAFEDYETHVEAGGDADLDEFMDARNVETHCTEQIGTVLR